MCPLGPVPWPLIVAASIQRRQVCRLLCAPCRQPDEGGLGTMAGVSPQTSCNPHLACILWSAPTSSPHPPRAHQRSPAAQAYRPCTSCRDMGSSGLGLRPWGPDALVLLRAAAQTLLIHDISLCGRSNSTHRQAGLQLALSI